MKQQLKLAFAGIGLACFTLVTNAQEQLTDNCKDQANRAVCQQNNRAALQAMREAQWHDELKIAPAQETAWKTFTDSLNQLHRHSILNEAHDGSRREEFDKLSAPERVEKVLARMEQRQTALRAHLVVLKALYATLTADQKNLLNKRLMELHHHRQTELKHRMGHSD